MTRILLIIILFATFASCIKQLDDDFPDFEQTPTLNAFFTTDSILTVHLATTGKIEDDSLAVIENGELNLFVNDTFVQKLNYLGAGVYASTQTVNVLNSYRCEYLNNNELTTVTDVVPQATPVDSVNIIEQGWVNMDGEAWPTLQFTINNNKTQVNYYEVWVHYYNVRYNDSIQMPDGVMIVDMFSTEFETENEINKSINFQLNSYGSDEQYAYKMELRTISLDYYKYKESLELYFEGRYPEFGSSTPAPYNLYSNVQNGFGIFAAYSSYFTTIINNY